MGCGGFGSVAEAAVVSIEGGETIGVAATPLDEQDGRVVAGDTASFLFQGVGRAHPRPHRRVVTDGSVGPLDKFALHRTHDLRGDKAVIAELLIDGPVHECTHLGQAGVGPSRMAQDPVATVAMLAEYRRARGGEVEEVQTWDLVSDALDATTPVTHDARLYQASAGKLLGFVRNIPAHARTLIWVGHNLGTQDLVLMLTGEADSYALEQTRTKFPASAIAGQAAGARFAAGSIDRPVVRPFEFGGMAPGLHRPDSAVGAGSVEGTADFSGSATRAKGADGLLIATPVPRRVCEITWLAAHLCVRRTWAMGRWVPFVASGLISLRAFRGHVGLSTT